MTFQDFVDADGITINFRMGNRSLARLQHLYEIWCSTVAPPGWRRSWVAAQRVEGGIELHLDDGSMLTVATGPKKGPLGPRRRNLPASRAKSPAVR